MSQLFLESFLQAITESGRKIEGTPIAHEANNIPCPIQNGGTVLTAFEVFFHAPAKFRIDRVIDIIR